MLGVFVTSLAALVVLLATERAAKTNKISTEVSRKIPHVVGSLAIATWPFFVSMHTVLTLGLVFTFAAIGVRVFNLFPNTRFVDRKSWGEPLFGLGVAGAAVIGPSKWVFAAAMLYLGVADSVAALVGKRRGKRQFQFFGHIKSLEGSLAFLVAAICITALLVFMAPAGLDSHWQVVIWLPLLATAVEAIAPWGIDNLALPIIVTAVLASL
ncbi:hypothetical protein A3D14_03450 [Candidatus Saccharibacteria bacterium RIFCSPHIGHO2_02_FULL_47_12]|nr:MAG: hypothetical protein A3D14_03450 [Candidatus Saccharibacteria bacterium RIFCSPHIGHO2_02_FULL_47_12]